MPTNVFFDTGTKNEQDLYEAIAIEQIKIQGQEVFYLPRKLVAEDNLFTEDKLSPFNDAYLIEMVFNETDGFGGEKELMGKFGLEMKEECSFTVARRRFEELIDKGDDVLYQDIYNSLKKRDDSDINRDISPLKIPKNAHILDTSHLKPDAIVDKILNLYTITNN